MFSKSLKIKSNAKIKVSEKKTLKNRILEAYKGSVTDEELTEKIFTNKSTVCAVKAQTHNEDQVTIYTVDKTPMFFEISTKNNKILPTVYALWLHPGLIPMLTAHQSELPRLKNGANLSIPGTVKIGTDLKSWGDFKKDDIFGMNLPSNKSAIAVGFLAHDSYDLYMANGSGVALEIIHFFGDHCWSLEPNVCLQPPIHDSKEEILLLDQIENLAITENPSGVAELSPDEVLKVAFLNSLKLHGKKLHLPLLTSTFYPQFVQPALDPPLDVKKTSYKKVGTFLKAMANENFIVIKEESKGVEKIVSVNLEHPEVLKMEIVEEETFVGERTEETKPHLLLNKMTQIYFVTEKTVKFFSQFDHEVGSHLDEKQIKNCVKDYVERNDLMDKEIHKVILDDLIKEISGLEIDSIFLEDLLEAIQSNMDAFLEMRTRDRVDGKGGRRLLIHIKLVTRNYAKKATLVSNLDCYGINMTELAKDLKTAIAASSAITEVSGYRNNVLLVQGNHVKFIHRLLTETYKISPKFIKASDDLMYEPKFDL